LASPTGDQDQPIGGSSHEWATAGRAPSTEAQFPYGAKVDGPAGAYLRAAAWPWREGEAEKALCVPFPFPFFHAALRKRAVLADAVKTEEWRTSATARATDGTDLPVDRREDMVVRGALSVLPALAPRPRLPGSVIEAGRLGSPEGV